MGKFISMTKQSIIDHTVEVINKLPESKAAEISDFADFVIKRYEDNRLVVELQDVINSSKSFEFLHQEEDLYTIDDIKEKYNG